MKKALVLTFALITACASPGIVRTGVIDSPYITEASGLAPSALRDDRLWLINDGDSPPVIHAIATDGSLAGSIRLGNASNVDWEAIASFRLDGSAWLLVADTGDNNAVREFGTIYVVEEPALADNEETAAEPAWTISFRWPGGPRDCEAVAVDAASEKILLLSKRTVPAELYELPLRPSANDGVVTATRLGDARALPQPTARDLERAVPERNWHWQPTAMDISADGHAAVILTYRAVYYFERTESEAWTTALQRVRAVSPLDGIREAESVALARDGKSVFVTVESPQPPLYRIALHP
jgi:hypothetical protein